MIVRDDATSQVFYELKSALSVSKLRVLVVDDLGGERFFVKLERFGWVEVQGDDYRLAKMWLGIEKIYEENRPFV